MRTDSAMRRELWRTFLSTSTQICVTEFDELAIQTPVDVVITDQQMDEASLIKLATPVKDCEDAPPSYDGGLIEVGEAEPDPSSGVAPQDPIVGPASVSLPADATARELKLAVMLVTQIVRLRRDYGTQDQLSDKFQQLAFQDSLTAVANRRAWDQELTKRWGDRFSPERSICLALFDVDQLKQVNDLLGHAEGDSVLRTSANALVTSVRDQDFVARLGGDEFGVLLNDIDPASAHRIADRIRCSTSRYLATGETSSDELPVTTSAGYACARSDDSVDSLYRRADEALRKSKQAGGNTTTGEGDRG
ncbi:MAG: GGDEF domain-containing protein [Pirellulaceae bacterium]|nr:GGDEF domain-containing protein [Pirellulaceae bacterium]